MKIVTGSGFLISGRLLEDDSGHEPSNGRASRRTPDRSRPPSRSRSPAPQIRKRVVRSSRHGHGRDALQPRISSRSDGDVTEHHQRRRHRVAAHHADLARVEKRSRRCRSWSRDGGHRAKVSDDVDDVEDAAATTPSVFPVQPLADFTLHHAAEASRQAQQPPAPPIPAASLPPAASAAATAAPSDAASLRRRHQRTLRRRRNGPDVVHER